MTHYAVDFRGRPACPCLAEWLVWYERVLLKKGVIRYSIDVAQLIGGAAASGGTHASGGAYDIWQHDPVSIWVARQMGAIAWSRGAPFSPHQHGVLINCSHNGPARYQIEACRDGYNGLGAGGRGGRDDGPRPLPDRGWKEGIEWAKALLEPPKPEPAPEPDVRRVKGAHISMQFSDTPEQMRADAGRIFARAAKRRFWWVTGTEADTGMAQILREAAALHGFRFHRSRGEWVAVRKEHIKGGWKTGYVGALESTEGRGRHSDRGVAWAAFDTKELGRITVGSSHFLTDGRKKGQPNYELNERLTRVIGDWGKEHGKESALVFIGADFNRDDKRTDVLSGQPFTTAADEVKKHPGTGHGPIDGIASYDRDARVEAVRWDTMTDDEFDLNTDHLFTVAVFEVKVLA